MQGDRIRCAPSGYEQITLHVDLGELPAELER